MTTTTQTFDVQLGTFKASYRLWKTTAPVDADGFGTFTLESYEPVKGEAILRFVLVRTEHEDWQLSRYASGLWGREPEEIDDNLAGWITDMLYKRLMGGAQ